MPGQLKWPSRTEVCSSKKQINKQWGQIITLSFRASGVLPELMSHSRLRCRRRRRHHRRHSWQWLTSCRVITAVALNTGGNSNDTLRHNTLIRAHPAPPPHHPKPPTAPTCRFVWEAKIQFHNNSCEDPLFLLCVFSLLLLFANLVVPEPHARAQLTVKQLISKCCPDVKQFGNNCMFQHRWLHSRNLLFSFSFFSGRLSRRPPQSKEW